jgi:transposase-like protein
MKAYDPQVKASVLAEIATGESIRKASANHGVNPSTASRWAHETPPPAPIAQPFEGTLIAAPVATPLQSDATQKSAREMREMVEGRLYGYMLASIDTLEAQVRLFGDTEWLRRQPAGDLGQLHFVVADKTARLLAAYQRGIDAADAPDD